MSVSHGQTEAAAALGLRRAQALKLVIIPQAKRVIIPPLTNQYLNLTKNSTLAVAIGYPDFVQIFTGTVLNVTGQAVEVVAMTLAVYLLISLFTACDEPISGACRIGAAMSAHGRSLRHARSIASDVAADHAGRSHWLVASQSFFKPTQHYPHHPGRHPAHVYACRQRSGFC